MARKIDGAACLRLRKRLGLNQADFWEAVGVTQSGGSRFENGRAISKPIIKLLAYCYFKRKLVRYQPEAKAFRLGA